MEIHNIKTSDEGPVILWGMFRHREDELESVAESIKALCGQDKYTLIAYEVDDWNAQFSPWTEDINGTVFAGKGSETIEFIKEKLLPEVSQGNSSRGRRPVYLMGYSLAGLFAVWAQYYLEVDGAISCSGSLWYPGFTEYVMNTESPRGRLIYLSLGMKEANTRNKLMAGVQTATGQVADHLARYNQVKYELNPGGHFTDTSGRIARGTRYILANADHSSDTEV